MYLNSLDIIQCIIDKDYEKKMIKSSLVNQMNRYQYINTLNYNIKRKESIILALLQILYK